jgi:hypothetical protein
MLDNVKLTYKRVGDSYEGVLEGGPEDQPLTFSGFSFAIMMTNTHRLLMLHPEAGLFIKRTDRDGLLLSQLEPALLQLLRTDPVAYIKANSLPDRVLDLRGPQRTSKLAKSDDHVVPRSTGLRHGHDTLADAFGEVVYARMKGALMEHPATGRWADLRTIEHWFGSHDTELQIVDNDKKSGWLLLKVELLLKTHAERFYYPREWNEFGSWITREQLQAKLDQFRKEKAHVTRK